MDRVTAAELRVLEEREAMYRDGRQPHPIAGRTVILVDDGLATGATMRAAVIALRQLGPRDIIVAVPVAPRETCEDLAAFADAEHCARMPKPFEAVGLWYEDFRTTTDNEVRTLLERATPAVHGRHGEIP